MSQVSKTIHTGLRVLGDAIVSGQVNGTTGVFSSTLYAGGAATLASTLGVTGKITGSAALEIATTGWIKGNTAIGEATDNVKTLTVYGNISIPAGGFTTGLVIEKAIDLNIGANTAFDIDDEYFRFSDGTNVLRVDSSNGIQIDATTVGIGNPAVAGTQLYVLDKAVTGNIAHLQSTFSGEAVVKINSRLNYDSQVSFQENSVTGFTIGNDGTGNTFNVKSGDGAFGANDILILSSASSQYLQSSTSILLYLKGLSMGSTLVINSATGFDAQTYFRENVTTKAAVGWDAGDDLLKLRYGTSISGTAALAVNSSNQVIIPALIGTGSRPLYASATGQLATTPVDGERPMRLFAYKVDHLTGVSAYLNMITVPIGAVVHDIQVWCEVVFNDSAFNSLKIGYNGDNNYFATYNTRTGTAVAGTFLTPSASDFPRRMATQRTMTAYLEETSGSSTGECYIYVWYSDPITEEVL